MVNICHGQTLKQMFLKESIVDYYAFSCILMIFVLGTFTSQSKTFRGLYFFMFDCK